MIVGYVQPEDGEEALRLFSHMHCAQIQASQVIVFFVHVQGYSLHGLSGDALEAFVRMRETEVTEQDNLCRRLVSM
ncbi:hypothetical protein FRX31_006088 [Thalictrum thalictroides]|uniref:Pentatricopeptide repeat-containing protein n=1 Tax=Thalictrum thalictroides TaxID=46969 RepID=A0A7J6X3J1_THATH|nr:hypothetical protein FRX31_006088 [Thalictrum thalictroides]